MLTIRRVNQSSDASSGLSLQSSCKAVLELPRFRWDGACQMSGEPVDRSLVQHPRLNLQAFPYSSVSRRYRQLVELCANDLVPSCS